MQNILEFNDYIVGRYGHFSQVNLKIEVPEINFSTKAPVSFLSDYSGMSLSVMWQTAGISNYLELGLLDLYYTTWDNMIFNKDEKSITIIDPKGMKVVMYG